MSKSNSGFSQIVMIMLMAGATATYFGVSIFQARESMKQIEIQLERSEAQSRISSGVNLVGSLIGGNFIQAFGDPRIVGLTLTPNVSTGSAGCGSQGPQMTNTHEVSGLWKFTGGSTGVKPKLEMSLPGANESLKLVFTDRDTTNTNPDLDIIFGNLEYKSPGNYTRPINASYRLRMEVKRIVTGTPTAAPRCAIFIFTRGTHGTNTTASAIGRFPNWGNAFPHYNSWAMAWPPPANLSNAADWQGTPGQSRWLHQSLRYSYWVDGGNFAPCNRMYGQQWTCVNSYKPVPLGKSFDFCGARVTLNTFTNHTPGSGVCGSSCDCYLSNQISPLVVDMAGHGVQFSRSLNERVKFDMGAGPDLFTPWIHNPESVAFLALDKNKNGIIDSIDELFGDNTKLEDGRKFDNGFLALAHYDGNSDQVIDGRDEIFSQLLLWKDLNKNGRTDPGELSSLKQQSMVSISLDYSHTVKFEDRSGNKSLFDSHITLSDGQLLKIYDVYFSGALEKKVGQNLASLVKIEDIEFK
jgi:hypothetical protein